MVLPWGTNVFLGCNLLLPICFLLFQFMVKLLLSWIWVGLWSGSPLRGDILTIVYSGSQGVYFHTIHPDLTLAPHRRAIPHSPARQRPHHPSNTLFVIAELPVLPRRPHGCSFPITSIALLSPRRHTLIHNT